MEADENYTIYADQLTKHLTCPKCGGVLLVEEFKPVKMEYVNCNWLRTYHSCGAQLTVLQRPHKETT